MRHTIRHDLAPGALRQAVEAAFAHYSARYPRYSPTLRWESGEEARFAFEVQGRALGGTVRLGPQALEVELTVPLVLRVFEGRARRVVEEEARQWLRRAREGASTG